MENISQDKILYVYGKRKTLRTKNELLNEEEFVWRVPTELLHDNTICIGDCLLVRYPQGRGLTIVTALEWVNDESELIHQNPVNQRGHKRTIREVLEKLNSIPKNIQ